MDSGGVNIQFLNSAQFMSFSSKQCFESLCCLYLCLLVNLLLLQCLYCCAVVFHHCHQHWISGTTENYCQDSTAPKNPNSTENLSVMCCKRHWAAETTWNMYSRYVLNSHALLYKVQWNTHKHSCSVCADVTVKLVLVLPPYISPVQVSARQTNAPPHLWGCGVH